MADRMRVTSVMLGSLPRGERLVSLGGGAGDLRASVFSPEVTKSESPARGGPARRVVERGHDAAIPAAGGGHNLMDETPHKTAPRATTTIRMRVSSGLAGIAPGRKLGRPTSEAAIYNALARRVARRPLAEAERLATLGEREAGGAEASGRRGPCAGRSRTRRLPAP